jgi:hypothetical protein
MESITREIKERKNGEKEEGTILDRLHHQSVIQKDYVPEGFDSVESFLEDMRRQYEADVEYDRHNREEGIEDKKFAAGEQWDPQVLQERKGLPCLVINNIPQFTAQVVGDWLQARKAIKVLPCNEEDASIAEIRGDLIRAIEAQSRADRVYANAFESLIQCGDGAFRVCVEYARDDVFDQDIFIRPIDDCFSVVWDRFSTDITGRDARRVFVNDRIPIEEFKAKYGNDTPEAALQDDTMIERLKGTTWVDHDSYQVTEYWRLIERKKLLGLFENGKVFILDNDNYEQIIQENGYPVKTRISWVTYAQMHLCTGFQILDGPYEYKLNRLPIIRMSGRITNVGGRRIRYGLVRWMKDAVRMKNYFRSVAAEQLGYAPKAKWMVTASAVEGRENELREAHTKRDPLLIFNDEAVFGQNVIPVQPPGIEAALLNEAAINTQDMKDVTGIHDASLGIRSNETSGRAILARQREGDVANLQFHDNGNAAILEAGDVINQLLPQIYDGKRIVRGIGEDERIKFIKLNDPYDPNAIDMSVGKFDVALSTGPSYTTKRVEAAQAMMEAIQVWPQLMSVAGDLVAKAQDWPGADKLAKRLKKTIPPQFLDEDEGGIGITPEQLQEIQMQLQQLQAQNIELMQQLRDKRAELLIQAYNAETQRIRALSDNQVDATETNLKAIKMILEGAAKADDLDIRKMVAQNNPTPAGKTSQPSGGAQSQ